ncbi:hypothetical protein [Tautonia sociabilis]|uniref:Uncharacterized protein n=1 Tax=Tautonia sociabilis TaxID=2080755 RepID=A0A432MFL8_9BACT|nr:hypothetical protein [Tautonia sociabilis]RUL85000.1 hypothetical protein TsocGM_19345 [Tautonia sociabilis]
MRRLGYLGAIIVAAGVLALRPGSRQDHPPVRAARAQEDGRATPPRAAPEPRNASGTPVWVAIDFVDLESGGSSEYFGQADPDALDALLQGRLTGFLRLDEVYWIFEDGEVERLEDDIAYGASAYFRVEAIRRVTPLKEGFPDASRALPPGDRIISVPGQEA